MLGVYFIPIFVLSSVVHQTHSAFEFTNVKCSSLDESYSTFEYCLLKSVNRTYKYVSLKVKLHQGPISSIKVNLALYKRLNGFKPFLYNVTVDACKFLRKPNSSPVARFIHNLYAPFSNMNHTCPYDNEVIVEKVPISHINTQISKVLPFPPGEYAFFSVWYSNGIQRATANVYGTLT